jgi:hypothetical protein
MRSLLFALAVGAIAPALATKLSSSPDGNCGSVSKMALLEGRIDMLMSYRTLALPASVLSTEDAVQGLASAVLPLLSAVLVASQSLAGALGRAI